MCTFFCFKIYTHINRSYHLTACNYYFSSVAPIAIIGGTFSVYSSAMKLSANNINSNVEFTPVSILYLLLLAMNYAIMPRLSKRYIHPNTNKQSVALAEEVVKMGMGLGGWVLSGYCAALSSSAAAAASSLSSSSPLINDSYNSSLQQSTTSDVQTTISVLQEQLQDWTPLSTLIAAGIPSALYALQGTLTYYAYQNLDAVTYNGLTQLKVLSSALCCYIILNKRQSAVQMISLGLLMASSVVFQGSWKDWIRRSSTNSCSSTSNQSKSNMNNKNHRALLIGVLPCLTATLLSGLAGALSQRSLQTQVGGMMQRDAYFYTVEISFLSAMCLFISMSLEYWQQRNNRRSIEGKSDVVSSKNHYQPSFFHHWTYATLIPITTKATAGLLTALVHRHLGSVVKGFALVLGLVFSALLQFTLEGIDLTVGQLVGTALVLFSSYLHFKG